MLNNQILTKKCCRCKFIKALDCFNFAARGLYKKHTICKKCKALYMRDYAKSGKLKVSVEKYKASDKGQKKIKDYRRSDRNKELQREYCQSPKGALCRVNRLAKYRAHKTNALPSWADEKEIRLIYKNCPAGLEVDHIIPLQGELISGLHVPWNMQYLTRSENARKSNSFDGTYDNNGWRNE